MRRRNTDLHTRVNGDLALDSGEVTLTSYAGLELFQRYLRTSGFNALIRRAFRGASSGGDFGVVAMVRLLIGLLMVGGRRLDHVAYVADDPLVRRFCRLQVLPTARTVSRWLTQFTRKTVERLQALNAAVIAAVIPGLRLHTVTVDVDGVVVSTGLQVERAFRGFNPHHRKVPSTKVFVAEATGDLVTPVPTAYHQHLLEQLRRLGQRIKHPWIHAAGHQIVTSALRGTLGQHGRFHFQKLFRIQECPPACMIP